MATERLAAEKLAAQQEAERLAVELAQKMAKVSEIDLELTKLRKEKRQVVTDERLSEIERSLHDLDPNDQNFYDKISKIKSSLDIVIKAEQSPEARGFIQQLENLQRVVAKFGERSVEGLLVDNWRKNKIRDLEMGVIESVSQDAIHEVEDALQKLQAAEEIKEDLNTGIEKLEVAKNNFTDAVIVIDSITAKLALGSQLKQPIDIKEELNTLSTLIETSGVSYVGFLNQELDKRIKELEEFSANLKNVHTPLSEDQLISRAISMNLFTSNDIANFEVSYSNQDLETRNAFLRGLLEQRITETLVPAKQEKARGEKVLADFEMITTKYGEAEKAYDTLQHEQFQTAYKKVFDKVTDLKGRLEALKQQIEQYQKGLYFIQLFSKSWAKQALALVAKGLEMVENVEKTQHKLADDPSEEADKSKVLTRVFEDLNNMDDSIKSFERDVSNKIRGN